MSQGLAALRDFGPGHVSSGSKLGRPAPSAACLLILQNSPSKQTIRFGSSVPEADIAQLRATQRSIHPINPEHG